MLFFFGFSSGVFLVWVVGMRKGQRVSGEKEGWWGTFFFGGGKRKVK
jgi:hypothetical protein